MTVRKNQESIYDIMDRILRENVPDELRNDELLRPIDSLKFLARKGSETSAYLGVFFDTADSGDYISFRRGDLKKGDDTYGVSFRVEDARKIAQQILDWLGNETVDERIERRARMLNDIIDALKRQDPDSDLVTDLADQLGIDE